MTEITPAYLVMVTPDNHNKYYRMTPTGDGFTVEFGRIGSSHQTANYPISQWNKKYNEKIKKGYVDQTHLMEDLIQIVPQEKSEYATIENKSIADIVERLQRMARKAISENYTISSNAVTQAMIDEAQNLIEELSLYAETWTIEQFNKSLITLFTVIPRKMGSVSDYLAHDNKNFGIILQKEQDLLDVMRGQVVQHNTELKQPGQDKSECIYQTTILEAMGLSFSDITSSEEVKIKSCLGSCADKFYKAWKVENSVTQKAFNEFLKSENISTTKLLWHGSRNENWWSIVNSGLVLRPTNAVITGKMFGYGIYFATKARKSLGYTSISGSYWAHGNSSSAFMALYEVAYGKPYDVHSFDSKYYNMNYENLQNICPGANCLHAHEGQMLRNDEIIVYKQTQTTIKYLVELK